MNTLTPDQARLVGYLLDLAGDADLLELALLQTANAHGGEVSLEDVVRAIVELKNAATAGDLTHR
ncbi:MAG: hypothetical protein U1E39_15805 [Planctomycetota bacterium]